MYRSIIILPKFKNINSIENIRKEYDPLFGLINPHITLMFPFESNLTKEEIVDIIDETIKNEKTLLIKLRGVSKSINKYGNYLFLN
nr:2'-5' RNA ligase family protein [Miniphocaeibacter massiliensis]